jgi:predicted nucleic acid-binding protein
MTTFIDTSVLIPLISEDSEHHQWCRDQIEAASPPLVVSDIVYAELSVGLETKEEVDAVIESFSFSRSSYTDEVLFRAGKAFLAYKNNDGPKDSLFPDFLIGALAEIEGEPLLTRDTGKVSTYFPTVALIHP